MDRPTRCSTRCVFGMPSQVPKRRAGTVRDHLASLEPHAGRLPVWRDELYLELHRGVPRRPDQKRHNRTLERLLREVETIAALVAVQKRQMRQRTGGRLVSAVPRHPSRNLHSEVFDQAEAVRRSARRKAVFQRDLQLRQLCVRSADPPAGCCDTWLWFV